MTITIGWWFIPMLLLVGGAVAWYLGSLERGMFGGIHHFWIGAGLLLAGLASLIVGVIK